MDDNHPTNDYGAYVISSEVAMSLDEMRERVQRCLDLAPEEYNEKVLHLRKCKHRDIEDTKRWHICMSKSLIAAAREHGPEYDLAFYVYRPSKKPLGRGKTYAYYIPYQSLEMRAQIVALFGHLDGRFLRSGTYQIHYPVPRLDGTERQYLIVSFEKTNGMYPKSFIRTLRAVLDDSVVENRCVEVKWCSHSVLKDVLTGTTK